MNANQLTIEVKSPVERNNDLIGRIINKALRDGGFQDVENYTQQGDPVRTKPLVSLLDAVRTISPDTFKEKVEIWTDKPASTEFEIVELLAEVDLGEVEEELEDVA